MSDYNIGTIASRVDPRERDDYLECDGSVLLQADFPNLYTAIGQTWANGETFDQTTHFRLPLLSSNYDGGDPEYMLVRYQLSPYCYIISGTEEIGGMPFEEAVSLLRLHSWKDGHRAHPERFNRNVQYLWNVLTGHRHPLEEHTHSELAPADHSHPGLAPADHHHDGRYAPEQHAHTGYADANHGHSAAEVGAAPADHGHSGYADANHSHTATEVGAAPADHSHPEIDGLPALDAKYYTPTVTAALNCVASAQACFYLRVGNIVTVSGSVIAQPNAVGEMRIDVSLPVPTNAGTAYIQGVVSSKSAHGPIGGYAGAARLFPTATGTANERFSFTLQYVVG